MFSWRFALSHYKIIAADANVKVQKGKEKSALPILFSATPSAGQSPVPIKRL
jgi:hypothetical protein